MSSGSSNVFAYECQASRIGVLFHSLFFIVQPAPKSEEEMMINIREYVDRLFAIVRPRKLLYLAIGTLLRLLRPFLRTTISTHPTFLLPLLR